MVSATLFLGSLAPADRLISIPTGIKLLFRNYRAELIAGGISQRAEGARLAIGLTREIETEFRLDRLGNDRWSGTFDVSYNVLPAIVDFMPGVSIGVLDVLDKTGDGRYAFLVATQRIGLDGDYNSGIPLEATVGVRLGRRSSPFVGVSIPFTWQFLAIADHDGTTLNAGFEFRPLNNLAVRWVTSSQGPAWSARWTARF